MPDMWKHYCPYEETNLDIGEGEECNWCGATEESEENDNSDS